MSEQSMNYSTIDQCFAKKAQFVWEFCMDISKIRFRCHASIMTGWARSNCCFEWIQTELLYGGLIYR